ncbi:MAG: hypothetical protein JSV03_01160, partial [Planctomycetota bacterium]
MPTFFARKYMRDKPGPTEQVVGVFILILLVLLVGTFLFTSGLFAGKVVDGPVAAKVESRFVALDDSDIAVPAKIEVYTDNLYEKIDGKEGVYRAFHVVELRFGRYRDTAAKQDFDVYVYDMAVPANAFGIYMAERSLTADVFPIGREGYISGTSIFFWKDKYYVYVLGSVDDDQAVLEKSTKIARAIADTISDEGEPFWAVSLLP